MDVSRGELTSVLAVPDDRQAASGRHPGAGPPVPRRAGRERRSPGSLANLAAAAGGAVIIVVAGTGVLAGQSLAHGRAAGVAVGVLALAILAGVLLVGFVRRTLSRASGPEGG